jgi:hypothetical protein
MNVVTLRDSSVPTLAMIDTAERIVAAVLVVLTADPASVEVIADSAPDPDRNNTGSLVVNTLTAWPIEADCQLREEQRSTSALVASFPSQALDCGWPPTSGHATYTVADTWPGTDPLPAMRGSSDHLDHHTSERILPVAPWNAQGIRQHLQPVQPYQLSVGEWLVWGWYRVSREMSWLIRDVRWQLRDRTAEWNKWLLVLIVLAICAGVLALWLTLKAATDLEAPDASLRRALSLDPQPPNGIVFTFAQPAKPEINCRTRLKRIHFPARKPYSCI